MLPVGVHPAAGGRETLAPVPAGGASARSTAWRPRTGSGGSTHGSSHSRYAQCARLRVVSLRFALGNRPRECGPGGWGQVAPIPGGPSWGPPEGKPGPCTCRCELRKRPYAL